MTAGARLNVDEVRAALGAELLDQRYGLGLRSVGAYFRGKQCPRCGPTSRKAFAVRLDGGPVCHRCGWRGDSLSLVAEIEGLDIESDFPEVLAIAAEIAGIEPECCTDDERRRRQREREAQREAARRAEVEREARRHREAREKASAIWRRLERRSDRGEAYLAERGLSSFVGCDDLVRFGRRSIAVPLYDAAGEVINVVARLYPEAVGRGSKILGLKGCPTRGMFGNPGELESRDGPVAVVEGLVDYLSALALWPDRAALGAHGATNLAHVARVAAEQLADSRRLLRLAPHPDDAGRRAARKAWHAIVDAGVPASRIRCYDTSAAGDLNDWLRGAQR